MTYDAADGYFLMFGGSSGGNLPWSFSNGVWSELSASNDPPSRNYPCLTYDWDISAVLLFGGANNGMGLPTGERNDTWTFSHDAWTELRPPQSPPATDWASCTYDSVDHAVVVFGGAQGTGSTTQFNGNQTWEFVVNATTGPNGNWIQIHTPAGGTPPGRFGASMAYDAACEVPGSSEIGCVVLYGGARNGSVVGDEPCNAPGGEPGANNCQFLHDTWEFQGDRWIDVTATAGAATPPGVLWATMTNASGGSVLIFGGQASAAKSPTVAQSDTFEFSNGGWTRIEGTPSPGTRFGAELAAMPGGPTILFSGLAGTVKDTPLQDDTWSFSNGVWKDLTYPILFRETGLPTTVDPKANDTFENYSVAKWGVDLAGDTSDSWVNWTEFDRPNGTYSYAIRAPAGYAGIANVSGTVQVTGRFQEVNMTFAREFSISFTESGLPSGTKWWVNVTGGPSSDSATTKALIQEVNGTYEYSVATTDKLYRAADGAFTVAGLNLTEKAKFSLVTYKVVFTEKGLPTGTEWWVNLSNGKSDHSITASMSFLEANGTYSYSTASAQADYQGPSGTVKVAGANLTTKVTFTDDS